MRYAYHNVIQDGKGVAVSGATVTVSLAGGSTAADIYTAVSGGTVDADGVITSGSDGTFEFFVDEADYSHSQKFRIVWAKSGFTSETWDYIQIFPDGNRTLLIDATVDQGDNSINSTLAWHIADLAGSKATIKILTGSYDLTTNTTVPSTIHLDPEIGAIFDGSGTLTINGSFSPGRYQVFDDDFVVDGLSFAYPEWWGAAADVDTPTDDSTEFASALSSLSDFGGNVIIDAKSQYYIAGDLEVPEGCGLLGELVFRDNRPASDLELMGSVIYLNSANTIKLTESSSLVSIAILRYGITLPANAAEVANYAGTAVTFVTSTAALGGVSGGHGIYVSKCNIVGFEFAIDMGSNWTENFRIEYINGDNTNGIRIYNTLDVGTVSNCHFWPSASIDLGGVVDADKQRSGYAYAIRDSNDWAKFINCFSYGYAYGFYLLDAKSVQLLGCAVDYTSTMTGTPEGVHIEGDCAEVQVIGGQFAGQYHGISANNDGGNAFLSVIGSTFWSIDSNAVLLTDGDLIFTGNKVRDTAQGIGIGGANAGKILVSDNIFDTITTVYAAHASQDQANWNISDTNAYVSCTNIVNGNFALPSFTAADTTPDVTGVKKWKTAGTATITDFDGDLYDGQELIIIGTSATVVAHNASFINLAGAANFTFAAGYTLHLMYDGVDWNEISRSTNA